MLFLFLHISTLAAGGVQPDGVKTRATSERKRRQSSDDGSTFWPLSRTASPYFCRREESSKYNILCVSAGQFFSNSKSTSLFFRTFDSSSLESLRHTAAGNRRSIVNAGNTSLTIIKERLAVRKPLIGGWSTRLSF